jgi:hypothetical protein
VVEREVEVAEPSANSNTTKAKRTRKTPSKRKAVSKKVKTTTNSKKKKEDLPKIPGITSVKVVEQIVESLKNNKRLRAIQFYRVATMSTLSDAVVTVDKIWMDIQLAGIDRASYPAKSCINCIGSCGKLKSLIEQHGPKLWDLGLGTALGSNCNQFMNEETLLKNSDSDVTVTFGDNYRVNAITVQINRGKILRISKSGQRAHINKILSENKQGEVLLAEVRKILSGDSRSNIRLTNKQESCADIRYKGIDPKFNETWEEYVSRVDSEIRKIRVDTQKKYHEMSDEDASKYIGEQFENNGLGNVLNSYGGDVVAMCNDFFPDKTLQQIASSTATHLMV